MAYLTLIPFVVIILILFGILTLQGVFQKEGFEPTSTDQGLISQPPNPNVNASPADSQPFQGEPAFIASAPGVIPGAAEISQGTTAFITNTPSAFTQQFAQATIVTNQQANSAYKDILQYLAQNPMKSTEFLNDIRNKFFDGKSLFKENIDFKSLASQPNIVFNS